MNETIRWLHLTDLHVGMADQDWLWPRMPIKFREDLKRIYDKADPWDLVLFTGDLVQKGTEYARLDEILDEIWGWFGEMGCDPKLLTVPGNHDLEWRNPKQSSVKLLEQWAQDPDVPEGFWNEAEGEYRQVVDEALANYSKWWKDTPPEAEQRASWTTPG